jgi:hypothetical protein
MFENRGGLWVIKPNRRLVIGINVGLVLLSLVQVGLGLAEHPVRSFQVVLGCAGAVAWGACAAINLRLASGAAKIRAQQTPAAKKP